MKVPTSWLFKRFRKSVCVCRDSEHVHMCIYVHLYTDRWHSVRFQHIDMVLSRFSHVRLCATPQTAAQQALPSLGFSRKEHWSGLPFPSPMRESEVAQSCPTLRDPVDCSPPGSSVHGIFQARVLEWVPLPSHGDYTVKF